MANSICVSVIVIYHWRDEKDTLANSGMVVHFGSHLMSDAVKEVGVSACIYG